MFVSAQKVFTIFVEKRCKVDEDREMKKCFYVRVNSKYFILNYLYIYIYTKACTYEYFVHGECRIDACQSKGALKDFLRPKSRACMIYI